MRRGCLLDSLLLLNVITVFAALGVGVAQGLVLAYHKDLSRERTECLFCCRHIKPDEQWVSRGHPTPYTTTNIVPVMYVCLDLSRDYPYYEDSPSYVFVCKGLSRDFTPKTTETRT